MAKKTVAELKAFFETGDKPTESQFADLIESFISLLTESEIEATILVNVPVAGDGSGGKILKKGDLLVQMGEYLENDFVITTDNGLFASGGYFWISDTAVFMGFNGYDVIAGKLNETELRLDPNNNIILRFLLGKLTMILNVQDELMLGKTNCKLGFFDKVPTHGRQTIVGAKNGNVALTNLLIALENLNLIVDNTT